jgi:hypothetical protein
MRVAEIGSQRDRISMRSRDADRMHVRSNRRQWIEGFRNGFTRGFEQFSNRASNQPVSWPRLVAGANYRANVAIAG